MNTKYQTRIIDGISITWMTTFEGFSIAMGIFFINFHSIVKLPIIFNTIENSNNFRISIQLSFVLITILILIISIAGYLLFGHRLDIVISRNMLLASISASESSSASEFASQYHDRTGNSIILTDILILLFIVGLWSIISDMIIKLCELIEYDIIYDLIRQFKLYKLQKMLIQHQQIQKQIKQKNDQQKKTLLTKSKKNKNNIEIKNRHDAHVDTDSSSNDEFVRLSTLPVIHDARFGNDVSNRYTYNNNYNNNYNINNNDYSNKFGDKMDEKLHALHKMTEQEFVISDRVKKFVRFIVFICLISICWFLKSFHCFVFVVSFVGNFFVIFTVIVLPLIFYYKLFWTQLKCWSIICYLMLILCSLCLWIVFTIGTVVKFGQNWTFSISDD